MLSRRAYLEETQREQRDEFLTNLKPGEIREGVVSSVVNFGAFVDLGGMDGLVHVSELSWKHVDHPSSVVQVGDEVTVQVLDVDLSRERISLSLKATQQDPWQEFADGHQVGELVYGRVTKLVPFGAFVQVGEGIEGLVHISEMAVHHVEAPEQVVTPGEELWVKIIDIDLDRRRISLSIKQAAEGGVVAAEYQDHFGEHAYDEQGNYIGPVYEEAPRRGEPPTPGHGSRRRRGRRSRRGRGRLRGRRASVAEPADRRARRAARAAGRRPRPRPTATTRPKRRNSRGEPPAPARHRAQARLRVTADDPSREQVLLEGSRGVESPNADGRRGHRPRRRRGDRGVHVRLGRRQARRRTTSSFVEAFVATSDIAKGTTGQEALQAGLIETEKVARARCRRRSSPTRTTWSTRSRPAVSTRSSSSPRRRSSPPDEGGGGTFAQAIAKQNLVAVTVNVDAERGVANQIAPGDHVDIATTVDDANGGTDHGVPPRERQGARGRRRDRAAAAGRDDRRRRRHGDAGRCSPASSPSRSRPTTRCG